MVVFEKIDKLTELKGKTVSIRGWVYRKREMKDKVFLVIRDSTGIVQCVVKEGSKAWKEGKKITMESSVMLKGKVKEDKRAPTGVEIETEELEIVGLAERFPIGRDLSEEFLLDVRHLWLRSRKMTAVMKIRSVVFGAIHEFFRGEKYHEIQAPILTPSACEGATDLFEVPYFGKKTYLTQSWQLYAEQFIQFLEKAYTITPAFRAEKSSTNRHLNEYWTTEMEEAWVDMEKGIEIGEGLISYICGEVAKKCEAELKVLERDVSELKKVKAPFPRMTYTEGIKLLEKDGMKIKWGKDLRTIEERTLASKYKKPLIVTHYPTKVKAFYMKLDPKDPKQVLAFDFLLPGSGDEVIGGSEREVDIKSIEKRLKAAGEDLDSYGWYMDCRRFGAVPHTGFGMGIERLIKWICGLETIRDAIPFPRTMTRMKP
jgi:asparaginyl-tRNA synthetase